MALLRHRQAGLLTGKFSKERVANLPDDDWRKRSSRFREPELSASLALVEKVRSIIAERNGRTVAQLAIAWVLRRPEVTAAIVGARRPSQIAALLRHRRRRLRLETGCFRQRISPRLTRSWRSENGR